MAALPPSTQPSVSSYYGFAQGMAAREKAIVAATQSAESSGMSKNAAINAALHLHHQVEHMIRHPDKLYQKDLSFGKTLYKQARKYAPIEKLKSGKYVLRTMVDGVPVIPPGMTGEQLDQFVEHTSAAMQERHAKTLVFISLSMPKSILRRMFATAWKVKKWRNDTVFVLRGWPAEPQGLPIMLSKIVPLFPSVRDQPTVEVDPIQFTNHNVHKVPVILHEAPNGHWGAIVGDGYSLSGAIHQIDRGKGSDHRVFGKLFPIIEPNLITTIERRAKTYNWKAAEHRAVATSMPLMSREFSGALPESPRTLNYIWSPAVVASHNIKLPDGQYVVKAGQHVNPLQVYLKYNPLASQQKFIVFNPQVHWQLEDAESWASTYRDITVMVAPFPKSTAFYRRLTVLFHTRIYAASPLLLSRIGVSRSPSLVSISGDKLSVLVPRIPPLSRPAFEQHQGGSSR